MEHDTNTNRPGTPPGSEHAGSVRSYTVTVTRSWQVEVFADDAGEAERVALEKTCSAEPDYTDCEVEEESEGAE